MLPGLGGGTGGVQLAPGQLANSTTAPLAAQNAAAATASGSVLLPNTSAPLLSAPGGAQPGATLPTPQINPNANFNNNVGGAAGTPVGSTGWSQYGYPGNPNNTSLAAFDAYNAKQPNINGGVGPNGVVPGTSMPASSTPPPTNLPTPQTQPTLQLGANGGLPPGLTPMPTVTQMMNTPQMNTAADFAAKYGTAATTPSLAQTTADKFNSLYSTPPKNTPTNTGEAQTAITDATTNQDQQNQDKNQNVQENFMDSYASMNPVLKTMFDQINTLFSQQSTRTSLVDEFTKLENDSGLQADKLALVNINNIMKGTQDEIAAELSKTGAPVSQAQLIAMTAARNKTLLLQASGLQDAITTKEDYIKQIMTLTQADQAEVDKQVSQQIGLDEKVAEMQINLDNAATQNYQTLVKNAGYQGLADITKGNPQAQAAAEQSLGLPKGALSSQSFLDLTNKMDAKPLQFVSGTANQAPGYFDPNTGKFTPYGGSNGGYISTLSPDQGTGAIDTQSGSILKQTGLSIQAFNYLTQGVTSMSRFTAAQRTAIMNEAGNFLNKNNLDYSTFQSRYEAYNKVLQGNVMRTNAAQIQENELQGTIKNLQGTINSSDLSGLRTLNVADLVAGKEINNPLATQYKTQLLSLVNELAGYNAAVRGNLSVSGGPAPDQQDIRDAADVLQNGLSTGSLSGFQNAIASQQQKLGGVLENSVDSANKAVWDLFGVGQNFQPKSPTSGTGGNTQAPGTIVWSGGTQYKVDKDGQTLIPVPIDYGAVTTKGGFDFSKLFPK